MHSSARPVHGGIRPAQLRALGLDPGDVVDFSASVSPLGPPAGLWEALQQVDLTAYPDPECLELREALANYHHTNIDRILVGNGSTELIHLLARAFISPSDRGGSGSCLLLTPTYGEYAGACRLGGSEILEVVARREAGFAWDLPEAEALILSKRPALVFACNPNNPTGVYLQEEEVYGLAQAATKANSILVLDEAYLNFVEERWDALSLLEGETAQNVVLLRSMTKDFALTSLRLGYCLASPEVTASLAALQPDWSVNGLAQAAGLVAMADGDYLPAARKAIHDAKAYLTREFTGLGLQVLPSAANFLLISVGDASSWGDRLMQQGIFVRDCTSFGLPDCIRVGIRAMPDCRRLVAAAKGLTE
ncbi:Putative threonine-phosphate decarboxylase [Geodia barretti]|uniref:histidinol-phosphate transaminase n=1 Tax=Geodia barretti TaxID=519541 RepID=A0AA35W3V7_GEOBA|nr:Putative threonine-phosphate decarboxylase [Geodia barretti]